MEKQPKLAHIWKYYPVGDKYHCEAWVCQTCLIVSMKNPFKHPGHVRDLEEKRKALLAEKKRKKLEKMNRRQADREQFRKKR